MIEKIKEKINSFLHKDRSSDYVLLMPRAAEEIGHSSFLQLLPIVVFTAITILIVRMHAYTRPMSQFFWTTETNTSSLTDFFSFNKMIVIVACGICCALLLCYSLASQSLAIRRNPMYVPMAIYCIFILLSYFFSSYKVFALWGWNDRFEGTIPLLCYMLILFYTMNFVKSEKNIKTILWALAISVFILSILGITQALDIDFFRTSFGQKLIVPNWNLESGSTTWQEIDKATAEGKLYLSFTFNNKEIYQTVYNINYVSFYLTLLIPVFGMLFILECKKEDGKAWKKMALGTLFAMIIYNFIGSASSGGLIGLGVIGLIGIVVLNKQLKKFIKPLIVLFIITGLIMCITYQRWSSELSSTFNSVFGVTASITSSDDSNDKTSESAMTTGGALNVEAMKSVVYDHSKAGQTKPIIDYIDTTGKTITMSINGEPLIVSVKEDGSGVVATDSNGDKIKIVVLEKENHYYGFADDRFYNHVSMVITNDGTYNYVILYTAGTQWNFRITDTNVLLYNQLGRLVEMHKIDRIGFSSNYGFGSGRGSIWSASNPLVLKNLFIGVGADCYCAVFPQYDYAQRFNDGTTLNLIVDKPHNMYLMMAIGTGGVSLIAVIVMYAMYLVQSFKTYWKREFGSDFLSYVGFGIFCGTAGFMFTGLVDDSTVSTMPMFYGLLGTGIAINFMLKFRDKQNEIGGEEDGLLEQTVSSN